MPSDLVLRRENPAALSAKHTISVLFADYWSGHDGGLPSSIVVRLLAEFGFSEHGCRAALRALVAEGVLQSWRDGRLSIYAPTPWTIAAQLRVARETCRPDPSLEEWSGVWTVLTFSASSRSGSARNAVRRQLRLFGLRPLYPGVWVAPRDRTDEIAAEMDYRGVEEYSVFTTRDEPRRRPFTAAWSADDIDDRYRSFIDEFGTIDPSRGGRDALIARSRAMDAWRLRRRYDPGLPLEVLPIRNRAEARRVFTRVYDGLREPAETHVRRLTATIDAAAAAKVWSFGSAGEHVHPAVARESASVR